MMLMQVLVVITLLVSDVAGSIPTEHNENDPLELLDRWSLPQLTQGRCDENWYYYPDVDSCYRYYSHQKTWKEAEEFCNQLPHYGNLATVTSDEHNAFISRVISAVNSGNPWAWIGLNDIWQEGDFTWSDGTCYNYRKWGPNEPNNHGNEDCTHIHFFSGSEKWNDFPCDRSHGFVCSYKLH
ncbi:C-type lectin-like [Hypanus sabinus]|uniref:C-type lectin-like n=1 Tax=Hypanus sabinus TaxID=79690 RepID=UPI0028C4635F|nr:C-type lectin-like [Hypanus sabinus]